MKALALYVPVIHEGYVRVFKKYATVDTCYVFAPELIKEFTHVEREIRAVSPQIAVKLISGLGIFKEVKLLNRKTAKTLDDKANSIVTASEEISRKVATSYFPKAKTTFDSIFLRWDEASVKSDKMPSNVRISVGGNDQKIMTRAAQLSENSSDWWRHVGALIVKNKKVILERFNTHVPSAHTQYVHGDPRDYFKAGINPEVTTALHCEQGLITDAAREGISLKGTSLYTTVFPCAMCAKQIAYSGIKTVYYASGHAVLDGESIMKSQGIELVFVKMPRG